MTAEGVLVDCVLDDSQIQVEIATLVYGLLEEAQNGKWPASADDWECRLAERAHEMVADFLAAQPTVEPRTYEPRLAGARRTFNGKILLMVVDEDGKTNEFTVTEQESGLIAQILLNNRPGVSE